jgi:hypothetical protein
MTKPTHEHLLQIAEVVDDWLQMLNAIADEVRAAKDDADIYKAGMIDEGLRCNKLKLAYDDAIVREGKLIARVAELEEVATLIGYADTVRRTDKMQWMIEEAARKARAALEGE